MPRETLDKLENIHLKLADIRASLDAIARELSDVEERSKLPRKAVVYASY